jgi:glycosyltransferase involved in cell wall biosynthesis
MKVALFVASQANRGTFFRGFFFAKYLARRGHEVTLVCSGPSATGFSYSSSQGFSTITLPYANHLLTYLPAQVASAALSCVRQLIDSSDVTHVFQLALPSTWIAAVFAGSTTFTTKRRVFFDWDDLWGSGGVLVDYGRIVSFIGSLMEEKFLRLAHGVTTASEYLSERARKAGAKRVAFIANGTENDSHKTLSKFEARDLLGLSKSGPILCHVGFTDLRNVWTKISRNHPDARLLIVGEPPKYNMRRRVKDADPRIVYTGRIDPTLVKTYLAASDILLLKTNNEVSELARFPVRLGDYLTAGRPIVAGDIGEIGRVLKHSGCGVLAEAGNENDFADRIVGLIAAPDTWNEMGAKSRQMAQKLSWDNLANDLEDFYVSA